MQYRRIPFYQTDFVSLLTTEAVDVELMGVVVVGVVVPMKQTESIIRHSWKTSFNGTYQMRMKSNSNFMTSLTYVAQFKSKFQKHILVRMLY